VKAAVCREFGTPLAIEEVELAPPSRGEVRVRVQACVICHSDIHYTEGAYPTELPAVYGHEAAGVVDEVGENVRGVKVGDSVVATMVRSCGRCRCCEQGYFGSCETRFPLDEESPLRSANDGAKISHGLKTGAFAEYALVDASQVVAVPSDVPVECAALLACGVLTGFGAVTNTAKVPVGASVVVIGTGGVGLNSVQAAALSGASTIVAVDLSEDKRKAARAFGATHALDPAKVDVRKRVKALTDRRGADFAFVTVGAKEAADLAHRLTARGGAVVIVGMPALGVTSEFDILLLADNSQRILGSKMGSSNIQTDIPKLIELYKQGRLKLDELITARYPLEEINEAIASVKRGEALRNVIVFP
jgi:Zn-dependent alcohol dehydrogenase